MLSSCSTTHVRRRPSHISPLRPGYPLTAALAPAPQNTSRQIPLSVIPFVQRRCHSVQPSAIRLLYASINRRAFRLRPVHLEPTGNSILHVGGFLFVRRTAWPTFNKHTTISKMGNLHSAEVKQESRIKVGFFAV